VNWANLTFARPWALWLLALLPLLGFFAYRAARRRPRLALPTAALLRVAGRGPLARLGWLPDALRLGALALGVIALARPQLPEPTARDLTVEGIDIIVALDLSTSMNAVDFQPDDRLAAAKEVLADFISRRPNDRLGLVVFAGEAFTQCPLTLDHGVLKNIVGDLRTGEIEDGTAIGNALATALNRLRDSDAKSRVVILITDGDSNAGNVSPMQAAAIARDLGVKVFPIMVGKICDRPDGCPVPYPAGRDLFGRQVYRNVVIPVNPDLLEGIADTTGGNFYVATDRASLEGHLEDVLRTLEKSRLVEGRQLSRAREVFGFFLFPAFVLVAVELLLGATVLRRFP
jgi:Ca-activated chloride channel family protein